MRLESLIDVDGGEFAGNLAFHESRRRHIEALLTRARMGGGEAAIARQRARGKSTAFERIEQLVDPDRPVLELSALAGHGLYDDVCPGGGLVAVLGYVERRPVAILANEASVKGGAYFPVSVKKHLRMQAIAAAFGLPCLYLVDSAGAFLPKQDEIFADREHFGRIFYNMAQMSAAGFPQLCAVLGSCTAGGAYVPAMSDEVVMVRGNATVFLGGPPLVKAATGQKVNAQELGGAEMHCRVSGLGDHEVDSEPAALVRLRELVAAAGRPQPKPAPFAPEAPLCSPQELPGVVPVEHSRLYDPREILIRLVDAGLFTEYKERFGTTLVCGFSRIEGYPIGIVANHGPLDHRASRKAGEFVELADRRGVPLLFLQNIPGFLVGREEEAAGITCHGARMVRAVSNARVPKLTIIVGGSHGAGNYGMCGRAYDPHLLWQWPNARVSVMAGQFAASVLETIGRPPEEAAALREQFKRQSDSLYGTARIWDDGILAPQDTRKTLGMVLGLLG